MTPADFVGSLACALPGGYGFVWTGQGVMLLLAIGMPWIVATVLDALAEAAAER